MFEVRGDLCFALRMLRRNSAFAAAAMLTLALGIGAATAIFNLASPSFDLFVIPRRAGNLSI